MTAEAVSSEQEVKFRVSDGFTVPHLGGKGLRHVAAGSRTLDAVYWDTTDMRLARRGHTIRHRVSDDPELHHMLQPLDVRGIEKDLLEQIEAATEARHHNPMLDETRS